MKKIKTMTPKQIKQALENADISQAGLARDLSVSRSLIYQVIHNNATSHRVRCHIAKAVGMPVKALWAVKDNPTQIGRPLTKGLYDHQAA
jgi:transcriptional regulator with XRE-family HTH domain